PREVPRAGERARRLDRSDHDGHERAQDPRGDAARHEVHALSLSRGGPKVTRVSLAIRPRACRTILTPDAAVPPASRRVSLSARRRAPPIPARPPQVLKPRAFFLHPSCTPLNDPI